LTTATSQLFSSSLIHTFSSLSSFRSLRDEASGERKYLARKKAARSSVARGLHDVKLLSELKGRFFIWNHRLLSIVKRCLKNIVEKRMLISIKSDRKIFKNEDLGVQSLNRIRLKKYLHKGSRKNQERKNLI
jgi:hypothetical protein